MGKSGGIIAIIAGILGLLPAALTLMLGGLGAAFQADRANSVIAFGWGGIFFCFLTIVFGAIAINEKNSKMPGILIVISSILGAIYGGKLVAVLMVLAFVGGMLAMLGSSVTDTNATSKVTVNDVNTASEVHEATVNTSSKAMHIFYVLMAIIWLFFIYSSSENKVQAVSTPENKNESTLIAESDPLKNLDAAQPSDLSPIGELAEIFSYGSDNTDLQRENKFNEIHGKIIAWQLPVYDIKRAGDGYTIQTDSHYKNDLFGQILVGTFVHVIARNADEEKLIASLKTGDIVSFKGLVHDSTMRNLDIKPAILMAVGEPPAESLQGHVNNMSFGSYLGKPPLEILGDEDIHQISKKLLGSHHDKFLNNIALGSEAGLEMDSYYLLGFGCNKDPCETEQAAFAIDKQTGEMFAVLATSEGVSFFGVDSAEKLPANLQSWYEQLPKKATPEI
ncbi:MAG: hypothetical protein WBL28_03365 [Methylotenera sp.]